MRFYFGLLLLFTSSAYAQEHWLFLDNGHVRLGVNIDAGGCLGWFSPSHSANNLLNAYDHGRYVQQSYYGDPDGSDWNGKPWRYNPVQGGSWKGVPATVLEQKADKHSLYVKTKPRQWASGADVDDMVMEQWFTLEGGLARLKYRMTYTGKTEHKPTHQELPAVFVTPRCDTLVFTQDGKLVRQQPGAANEYPKLPERWAAWVDKNDQGLGIWFPHADLVTCYRVRGTGVADCSYLAPLQTFGLKPGQVFEYEVVLAIGSVEQIKAVFAKLEK